MDYPEPGPELDALVAEKVMGWERREHTEPPEDFPMPSRFHGGLQWWNDGKRKACAECGDLPSFSTSIADAWEVAEHICSLGCQIQVNTPGFYSDGTTYCTYEQHWCLIQSGANETTALFTHFGEGQADTTPHAICLAALKAVGEPK